MPMNAVLAELSFRGFGNTKEDKSVTDETKARLGLTNKKAGKWQKFLLPPAAMKRKGKAQGKQFAPQPKGVKEKVGPYRRQGM